MWKIEVPEQGKVTTVPIFQKEITSQERGEKRTRHQFINLWMRQNLKSWATSLAGRRWIQDQLVASDGSDRRYKQWQSLNDCRGFSGCWLQVNKSNAKELDLRRVGEYLLLLVEKQTTLWIGATQMSHKFHWSSFSVYYFHLLVQFLQWLHLQSPLR